MTSLPERSGARLLVDQLLLHGVEMAFGVPGESYLAVLDALYDSQSRLRLITCRHEAGAANMAEAYAKLTGRPGVCLVTRGPGATQASVGLHTAFQDSTPLLLLVGQVQREALGREAFQEVNYLNLFQEVSKWTCEIQDPRRIPELVAHAWQVALSGRPGPVVLALPQDMLTETCVARDAAPLRPLSVTPTSSDLDEVERRLRDAERPLVIVGGSLWSEATRMELQTFAESWGLPVAASFRCQDRIDNDHLCYVGELGTSASPRLRERVREADVLLALGARLGEMTTQGYTLLEVPVPQQALIHIHPRPEELNSVYHAEVGIPVPPEAFLKAMNARAGSSTPARTQALQEARAEYERHRSVPELEGPLNLAWVLKHLREVMPRDTILTNGAGNYAAWGSRFWEFHQHPSQIGPTSGAMGYGLPAAVASKLACPEREVVCLAGDGCLSMALGELGTAVQEEARILVIVVNNGMYGTIRTHQERDYPGRVHGTDLKNPDFAGLARSFGMSGECVTQTEEFPEALARARSFAGSALIELRLPPQMLSLKGV
ncbi:MAG: thiamine pyrophosphate-binding protein [bacterium]